MTQLATREQVNGSGSGSGSGSGTGAVLQVTPRFDLPQMWQMAEYVAASGLFPGCKSPEQAFCLMMVCDAEGLHPIVAMRRYHIIPGPDNTVAPSMRSDAMQAEFQARGGVIEILRSDAEEARAIWSHPKYQPKPIERVTTYAECVARGITTGKYGEKKNWQQSRAAMLWARHVTSNIRLIYPGIVAGMYSPEEIEDMQAEAPHANLEPATVAKLTAPVASLAPRPPLAPEVAVPGYSGPTPDPRVYSRIAEEAVAAENAANAEIWADLIAAGAPHAPIAIKDLCAHLIRSAINVGHCDPPASTKYQAIVAALDKVYREHREWLRGAMAEYLHGESERTAAAMEEWRKGPEVTPAAADDDVDRYDDPDEVATSEAGSRG